MLRNKAIKRKLVQLILVPCTVAVLLLTLSYYFLHAQFIANHKIQKNLFIHSLFTDFTGKRAVDESLLNSLSLALLSMEGFRSVALLDENHNTLWTRGLPLHLVDEKLWQHRKMRSEQGGSFCSSHQCYTRLPTQISLIAKNGSKAPVSDIVVVTDNLRLALATYQSLIALLFTLFISLILTTIYVRRFREAIIEPLEKIHAGIQEYIRGRYDREIPTIKGKVFNDLVTGINQLATLQKSAHDNLQQNIDQSTAELRETLETVEIQNIELDIARKTALQASRVKSEFLANTSHEIRTPLNGIIGFSELLKKTELNTQQSEYLETIDESAKGLLTIINDILDFSRLEIGKLTLEYKPVRLRQVVEESLRLAAPTAHEKKLRLLTVIDHDIPEHLLGDPLRLKQVLSNLLSNAIKFTNTGHILISVSKEDRADNQITIQFRITDSGIGLNQDQQDQLFDAFTQLDSSESRAHGGTGLGLAIAKGLVDRMNGQIGVESEPGKGATFWFTSTLGRNPNAANTAGYLTGTLRNIRAMVYDCSTMSRTEITHYLRGWGAHIHEISRFEDIELNTEEACRSGQIHLAILDAQVNDKQFDKRKLREIVDTLNQDYSIPAIVLGTPAIQRQIEPALEGTHSTIISRPIFCNRLHQIVCEQLGIIIPDTDIETSSSSIISGDDIVDIRILAVDDNPANLRLVSELLKDLNVVVVAVDNGADALKLCATEHFDLVLMDIQMPGMDGLQTTKELRKRENPGSRTPVVALTAHAANEQKSKLLLAGMDDYLTKPVSENELRHIIDRWVSRNPHKRTPPAHTSSPRLSNPTTSPTGGPTVQPLIADVDINTASTEPVQVTEEAGVLQPIAATHKLIDLQQSLSLAKNKADLARDMLQMLLESLPEARDSISVYLSEGSHTELQEVIHKLHGGCCYCGVPKLKKHSSELDADLQRALQNNEILPSLEQKVSELLGVIQEMLVWQEAIDVEALFAEDDSLA